MKLGLLFTQITPENKLSSFHKNRKHQHEVTFLSAKFPVHILSFFLL